MSTSDLCNILRYKGLKGKEIPSTRSEREEIILTNFSDEMNDLFKIGVKEKFRKRWESLTNAFDSIQPIDVQAYFKCMFDPKWLKCKLLKQHNFL